MSAVSTCSYNKYGRCKYGRTCNFSHVNEKCQDKDCRVSQCDLRHPDYCRYILRNLPCKFGDFCSFEHDVKGENHLVGPQAGDGHGAVVDLEVKLKELEMSIKEKDEQIKILFEKIQNMESAVILHQMDGAFDLGNLDEDDSETTDSEVEDLANEALKDYDSTAIYKCSTCDFQTCKENGLKIHCGRVHRYECEQCDRKFKLSEDLRYHKQTDHEECNRILSKIENPEYENLVIKSIKSNSTCIGVFSWTDTTTPLVFLHSDQCWNMPGAACSDLPEDHSLTVDIGENKTQLHMRQSTIVCAGVEVDWEEIEDSLKIYA